MTDRPPDDVPQLEPDRVARRGGSGPLAWTRVAASLTRLVALAGVEVAPRVHSRRYPEGPAEGFRGGAPDEATTLDLAAPGAADLGEDLASVEVEATLGGAPVCLAWLGRRDEAGAAWEVELEALEAAPDPALWQAALEALGGEAGE